VLKGRIDYPAHRYTGQRCAARLKKLKPAFDRQAELGFSGIGGGTVRGSLGIGIQGFGGVILCQ